ncbi:MAG: hypothetical protein JWQ09_5874 [Segetibacter sp.]|nr:hypothetical protein [Segetibacter sp.]
MFNFVIIAISLFKNFSKMDTQTKPYPQVVQDIHNEFNNAGERLLQESLDIIEKAEKIDLNKASRLNSVGFSNNPLLAKANKIEAETRTPALMAQIVLNYQKKYPLYKFISNADIDKICKKYNLVRGNTEQFIGFVPEKNLSEIEKFTNQYSVSPRVFINNIRFKYTYQQGLQKVFLDKLKSNNNFIRKEDFSYYRASFDDKSDFEHYYIKEYVGIESIEKVNVPPFDICAPKKDMISNEKWYAIKGLLSLTVSVAPDPVVLYPVEHGAIIVTAWGDEASDPLVLNEQMN